MESVPHADKSDIAFVEENNYHRFVFLFGKCWQDKITEGILVKFDTQSKYGEFCRILQNQSGWLLKTLTCYEKEWDEAKRNSLALINRWCHASCLSKTGDQKTLSIEGESWSHDSLVSFKLVLLLTEMLLPRIESKHLKGTGKDFSF